MMTRYVLHPGPVRSKTDGDVHHISASQLIMLYRVNPRDCVVYPEGDAFRQRFWQDQPGDVHLYPRTSGNYTLPERK